MSDSEAQVSIGAKIDDALAAINQIKTQLGSITTVVENVNGSFMNLGKTVLGVLGVGFSLSAINSFVRGMGDAGLHSEQLAAQLGVTGGALGEMKAIAKLTGVDIDTMAMGMNRLSLNVQGATKDAFSPSNQALKVLGLTTKDLLNLPADQYFGKLQEAVSKFNPSMNLTNALTALGGRSMLGMLPALLMGKEAFDKWGQSLKDARYGLEGFAPKAADTHARLTVLDASIDGASKRIFLALKPALDLIIGAMSKFFQSLDVKTIKEFASTLTDVLTNAVIGLIVVFNQLGDNVDYVLNRIKRVLLGAAIGGAIGVFGAGVGVVPGAVIGGGVVAMWDAFMASFDKEEKKAGAQVDDSTSKMIAKIKQFSKDLKEAMSGTAPGAPKEGKADAGQMNLSARTDIEAAIAKIQGEIALVRGGLAQKLVLYQRDADMWGMTEQEKLRLSKAASIAAQDEETTKLQAIRDKWKPHTKEWEEANRKMIQTSQGFATEVVRINADMARNIKSKLDEVGGAFMSSFNGQLRGLLAGTTTWKQAFKSIMGDMLMYLIQAVEKMVMNWITGKIAMLLVSTQTEAAEVAVKVAGEAAKTGATVAGVAARTGAEEVGLASAIGIYIADAMASIGASLAKTFAALTAWFAMAFGPYAPAAALAATAGIGAIAYGMIKGFDVGTDNVVKSGLAMIHKGEKIVPAEGSGPYTGAGAGGPGGGNAGGITINAWDGHSVANWLKRGGAEILAKHIGVAMTTNPSLRPGY